MAQVGSIQAAQAARSVARTDFPLLFCSFTRTALRRRPRAWGAGALEALALLIEHQEAERESLEAARSKARRLLLIPMRPEQRDDAKAALAALEKEEPWMDDNTPTYNAALLLSFSIITPYKPNNFGCPLQWTALGF